MQRLPLDGVRIADFGWVIAAPYATQWLAVMGAEVIRIESNQHIDINRRLPPYADGIEGENRSGLWNGLNMGKLSCTIDLNTPKGVELAKRIVSISDVVIENFAYGRMGRFGLSYDEFRELKSALILISSSGVGRTGPERTCVAYNEQLVAYSGLASITGYPEGNPTLVGGVWADHVSATTLAFAILAALHHRAKTGEGQYIDISMTEVLMSKMPEALMDYTMNKRVRTPMGNRDEAMAPHGVYPCQGEDKWVAIAVGNDEEWQSLCRAMGDPDWTKQEKFADQFVRWQNQDELDAHLGDWTQGFPHYEVMEILQRAGIPAGASQSIEEVANDRHLRERGFVIAPEHLEVGKRELLALPCKLNAHPELNYKAAPALGQHNEYVFLELLGISDEEFAELIGEGVIH